MTNLKTTLSELNRILEFISGNQDIIQKIDEVIEVITDSLKKNKKIIFCGNGGSAAEAQHLAAELSGKFYLDRPPLKAEACHVNSSFITAVSNDYDFTISYSRYIEGFGEQEDVLIGLSTSGNSENIVNAFIQAQKKGLTTIALTGKSGGELKHLSDYIICIPSINVPRIQEAHLLIGHFICEIVEKNLFGKN